MLRTGFLSRWMAKIETAPFYALSGLLWLGAHTCVETLGAAAGAPRLSAAPTVLTMEQEKSIAEVAGSEFTECAVACPLMLVVPAGKFTMGSSEAELDRTAREGPQHEVTIAEPFAVSKYEVTFDQWDACVTAGACPRTQDA